MKEIFLISAIIILLYMTFWFVLSIFMKRNDIVDIAWGLGYVVLAIYYLSNYEISSRALLLATLISIWGIRLAIFVFLRNRGKKEDFRYLNWRNSWKLFYLRSYFQIFLLQGFLLMIIISPFTLLVSNSQQSDLNYLDLIGVLVWLIGFIFETAGDYQMSAFKKKPENKGKIIESGLWKYTRHPNYFGEVSLWWGIFIITASSPGFLYGLLGPITITVLILFVSGIPMLEEKFSKRPDFAEYKKRTSIFFPMPPRKL